jgi:phosphatidylinositol glycan class T
MGIGNERGSIAISLKSTDLTKGFIAANNVEEKCKLQVNVLQIVPWYIKVYYHTLQILVDEKPHAVTDFVEKMSVSPSEDKVSPGVMELVLKFPCEIKSAVLNIEFDKVCSNSYSYFRFLLDIYATFCLIDKLSKLTLLNNMSTSEILIICTE